jgi:hypothetical protein
MDTNIAQAHVAQGTNTTTDCAGQRSDSQTVVKALDAPLEILVGNGSKALFVEDAHALQLRDRDPAATWQE